MLIVWLLAALLGLQFVTAQYSGSYVPKFIKNKYGNYDSASAPPYSGVKTFTKTKTNPSPPAPGSKTPPFKYKGGCNSQPPPPMNAGIRCSVYSGCRANCIPNYQFPNGATQLEINCNDGTWEIEGAEWDQVPSCEPICEPRCENNGICIAPNKCNCPENFSGPQCQLENKPCYNFPAAPINSRRTCRSNSCTITCMAGHQFPDGSSITNLNCKNGRWVPAKAIWKTVPDCEPTCTPPCENGGNCLSFNVCQCPQDYRGAQCQYRADVCSPKRLQFNGGYNCSGDPDGFSCTLNCPEGIQFEVEPQPYYRCLYQNGIFKPQPIPQCVFPDNVQVLPGGGSSHTFYEIANHTGFNLNSLTVNGYTPNPHLPLTIMTLPPDGDEINVGHIPHKIYNNLENNIVFIEDKLPTPGVCFTWQRSHYKTFDGKIYSFDSLCPHTLIRDGVDNTFAVVIQDSKHCSTLGNSPECYKIIKLYFQDKEYILDHSDNGFPILKSGPKLLPIPAQFPGLRVQMRAHHVVVTLDSIGARLKWDGDKLIQVEVRESLWNRTEGLCGRLNGLISDDLTTKDGSEAKTITAFADSWKIEDLDQECNDVPSEENACHTKFVSTTTSKVAKNECKQLISDQRFSACFKQRTEQILDVCQRAYCSCRDQDPLKCACETINVYLKDCTFHGIDNFVTWRNEKMCPMKCSGGRIYRACGPPKGQPVCGATTEMLDDEDGCVEGCYCPDGTVLHENQCITLENCPCRLRGRSFEPGSQVPKDCNTCTCDKGQWICTQVNCGARCAAVGDPHYVTFDGKKYDFMGQCSYYLMKTNSFSIEAENVACAGSISQAMNLPVSVSSGLPSCTKAVTIKIAGQTIKLKQNHDLVVNGQDITQIPYYVANVTIKVVSSIFLQVTLPNGVQIWWDGVTRVYIDAPALFKEKTKGLCGTFNYNQKDDFLTPENDVEQSVINFANKWKTSEKCNDVPDKIRSHPCNINIHNKPAAEKHCQVIKSELFEKCHWFVDPESYYQDCLFDMCSCEFKTSKCLCPIIAAYGEECSRKGVKIDWRDDVRECGVHCPGGQKYQICGNSCTRSCDDITTNPDCRQQCVEGCNCPEGEALDDQGECIPIGRCQCQHDGLKFNAGYKEVRPASKGPELCTCINAQWTCRLATTIEQKLFPKASDLKSLCSTSENMEFTTCESPEPVTCRNMHAQDFFSATVCHPGCKCKDGYVLDSTTKKCVKPTECPCHHGGKSYHEKDTIQNDCNTCECNNGKWRCTERACSSECSAWGDSHFKTFDGKHYDYQGQCDYVLAKGSLGGDSFDVTIQNVPCGSLGTSCSKSVTIRAISGEEPETLVLTRDKPLPEYATMKHLSVRQKGLIVIVEGLDLGILVKWDKGTRVYVKLDTKWKNKVKGLCGNYNDNDADDFQTPSGGVTEVSAQIFGDSWKLQSYCPEALEITNTCEQRPERRSWALKKCGILKSPIFAPCHSEVPIDDYFEKCIFDTCACDQGGDCQCLCTALAAYAQECNNRGVPVKWRSQKLCPMQCDERCTNYSPCVSTCPYETCDNLLTQSKLTRTCQTESCIEGCAPKPCPPGHIYLNSSLFDCVPRNTCKPICMEIEGVTYYEGELIEEDDCHSCFCSREQKICKGVPCTTLQPSTTPMPPVTHQLEQLILCQSGWTQWVNQDKVPRSKTKTRGGGKQSDIEPVPSPLIMNKFIGPKCNKDKMIDIQCRTVKDHLTPKETGLDVECSLERGLVCSAHQRLCQDFEIRVRCQCEPPTTTAEPELGECDVSQPHREHPTDCHLFYHCEPSLDGPKLVEKTCGLSMYYNPVSMICDWPYSVIEIKPECRKLTTPPSITEIPTVGPCPDDEYLDSCALKCDRMCLYYNYLVKQSGRCLNDAKCDESCVSANKKLNCPQGMYWANNETCVTLSDCLCRSNDGKPVKPGTVYWESPCTVCQCIDNYYTCDDTCAKLLTEGPKIIETSEGTTVPPFTVTPPKECDKRDFIDLIQGDEPLPDEAFNASSYLSAAFKPQYARFEAAKPETTLSHGGSWAPEYSNTNQYLDVNLGRQEPIYGIKIKGSPLYNEYVTSFKVLYSPDGNNNFIPVVNKEKLPQIFRGSIDNTIPIQHFFEPPFEAQIVRIKPETWHNGIALKVELIGCGEHKTTTAEYEFISLSTTPKPKFCEDPMGLGDGTMNDQQISVSSSYDRAHDKSALNMSRDSYWQPLTNSPTEFIQFDFVEPRNVTGFVTKGGANGWVTAFKVQYSHDNKIWNPVLDRSTLDDKIFLGNFDTTTPQQNNFDLPINTRYIKLIPSKWNKNIELQVEIHGCFKPYPFIEVMTEAPSVCNDCPGINASALEMQACHCAADKWWDGEKCVGRTECPCIIDDISYAVGTVYENEDCSQCLCKLGGVSHCSPKLCQPCDKGLRSTLTSTCQCTCQPCPDGTTLCPTSNICINSTLWCDGIQDCPDDELSCFTTTVAPPTTEVAEKKEKKCPVIECPQGYKKELRTLSKSKKYHSYLSPMFSNYGRKATKSNYKGNVAGYKAPYTKTVVKRPNLQKPVEFVQYTTVKPVDEPIICPEYRCVSMKPLPKFVENEKECPAVFCPLNYIPLFDIEDDSAVSNECPRYTCNLPPPPDAVCNVTGRTFNTFDETEYKYDICNHVLARDLADHEWDVSLKKNCSTICTRNLIIRHQDHLFILYPDLTVEYDGYKYTVDQTKKIGTQTQAFSISQLGNTLLFDSSQFGFWIIWDQQGNVKLGVVRKLLGKVDGLCGYFNEDAMDDKRKPDGSQARTTAEFGDSWTQPDQPLICAAKACPTDIQKEAWEMCNEVKDQVLTPCATVVDIEAFISHCMETTCDCLEAASKNHTAEEECRCKTLEAFVVDCLSTDPSIDLSVWRMQLDCPVTCEAPLIHHDCYQRKCELTCESISDPSICPKLPNLCFPGCYCPPGFVKKGDNCLKPSSCRDCECNVLPHLQYVTYDESNFTVNGNCVYVMSRDAVKDDNHKFQVLITNAPCKKNPEKTCVGKVTILYMGHKIHIIHDSLRSKLKLIVDGERIDDFSELLWMSVRETAAKHFKILLNDIQVEVSVYFPSLGVSVKAPSHKYGGKLEGLCGDCNKVPTDDLKTPSGDVIADVNEFALSWLYDKLPGGQSKEKCENQPEEKCVERPPDEDPCNLMLDYDDFGQCLRILDPSLFLEWCKKDTCDGSSEHACTAIEAYARDCASAGFCIDWRNNLCPAQTCSEDKIYEPCGTSCPKTCESIKSKEERKCKNIPVEGCFCPEGKILRNETCVYERNCEVCDEDGHHPGDEWKKDKCTICRCEGTTMKCDTEYCPGLDRICEKGYQAVKVPSTGDECCDKYACLPEPTAGPTCETPQPLNCGPGQIMKLDTKPNGCQQFICQCKPQDECDSIDLVTEEPLADGYIREIDKSGCCPEFRIICKPELCPKPLPCEQFYTLTNNTLPPGECCPKYTCEPPKDKCIYEQLYAAAPEGGEKARAEYEKQKSLKKIDERWQDGPCRTCKCLNSTNGLYSSCTKTNCPSIETSQDYIDYVLEPVYEFNECCPSSKRVACKFYEKTYQIGDKWQKGLDYCTNFECINGTDGVERLMQIINCDKNCDLGFDYVPAEHGSKQCCGSCKPVACVVDGAIYKVDEEWKSDDFCTKYDCLNVNGSMQVHSVVVNCPKPPPDYYEDFLIENVTVKGECCKVLKPTACKVGNKVYKIGETWPSPDGDKCKNVTCLSKGELDIVKQVTVETCKTDCAKGWEYKENDEYCCGECVQVACIVNNTLRQNGESWTSADNCTIYSCDKLGDQFAVSSQQESCPNLENCPEENVYMKGCCKHCNITALPQTLCVPESMALNNTIGIIKTFHHVHGECWNSNPIQGFSECLGSCPSSTFFNIKSGTHESDCSCCQATKYESVEVELSCKNGQTWKKKVAVPIQCGCEGCVTQHKYVKNPTKSFVKV